MQTHRSGEITKLLEAWREGGQEAEERLIGRLYQDLKSMAAVAASKLGAAGFWQAGDLLHESLLQLREQRQVRWQNRKHFFSIAARVMHRTLTDAWRHRTRQKRGGGVEEVSLEESVAIEGAGIDRLVLEQALGRLAEVDPVAARAVELLAIEGFSYDEAARLMGVGRATVSRSWRFGRSFLRAHLDGDGSSVGRD